MNRITKLIKSHPIMIFFIIMCVIYLPTAIVSEPESVKKAFVTAMSIDKAENELEVSIATEVPIANVTSTEKIKIISARGATINDCLSQIIVHLGKEIELAHTNLVIVDVSLATENMAENLNFLITNFNISAGTEMIATSTNAKALLNASLEMFNSIGVKVYQLLNLNEKYLYAIDSTIGSFYQGYLSKNQVSFLNQVDLKQEDYEGIMSNQGGATASDDSSSSQSSGGGTVSGGELTKEQGQNENKVISNNGNTAVFKGGKYITTLTPEETKALNFINSKARNDFIQIKNINDNNLQNGRMTLKNTFKNSSINTEFKNNRPIVNIKIDLALRIEEIYDDNYKIKVLSDDTNYFTKQVREKIEEEIKSCFIGIIKKSREFDADMLSVYGSFDLFNHKEFQIFLKTLLPNESFYDKIIYKINVNSISIN